MARKIEAMYQYFGRFSGNSSAQCKSCCNFHRYHYRDKDYKKCEAYGESNSEATDWNVSYEACGLYSMDYSGTPIINLLKHSARPKAEEPLAGQISIDKWIGGD
jgi:hypothetical protein